MEAENLEFQISIDKFEQDMDTEFSRDKKKEIK